MTETRLKIPFLIFVHIKLICISGKAKFYISKSGTDSEICGTLSNPCRMFKQVWKQIEQNKISTNSTAVITDTDIIINDTDINLQNSQDILHPIHITSKEDEIQININHSTLKGVRLKLDNSNISLQIQNSRFIDAGISIETEENRRHLSVKIANSNFSGHFPEDTLLFNNSKNVSIECCHFNDLQFTNNESVIITAVDSVSSHQKLRVQKQHILCESSKVNTEYLYVPV